MELINLKTAITFRVDLRVEDTGRIASFSTKAFRGKRGRPETPEPRDHVVFDVHEIELGGDTVPWLTLKPPQRITVLWSNVLSVQYEDAIL